MDHGSGDGNRPVSCVNSSAKRSDSSGFGIGITGKMRYGMRHERCHGRKTSRPKKLIDLWISGSRISEDRWREPHGAYEHIRELKKSRNAWHRRLDAAEKREKALRRELEMQHKPECLKWKTDCGTAVLDPLTDCTCGS